MIPFSPGTPGRRDTRENVPSIDPPRLQIQLTRRKLKPMEMRAPVFLSQLSSYTANRQAQHGHTRLISYTMGDWSR